MRKLIRPQDRILMLLANIGDVLMFLHEEVGIGKMSLKQLYGWAPSSYKRGNFTRVVRRMFNTGYLEKIIKNGKPYVRLTGRGKKVLSRDYPLFSLQRKQWDRKWRLVIFDIKEPQRRKRDFFRKKLLELGLGMIQKSVYLTPFDIAMDLQEFIEAVGLKAEVFIMEVNNILVGNAKSLAKKIWPLEKLNKKYEKILEKLEKIEKLKNWYKEQSLRNLREKYLQILITDPFLPKELLPDDWLAEKVIKSLGKM